MRRFDAYTGGIKSGELDTNNLTINQDGLFVPKTEMIEWNPGEYEVIDCDLENGRIEFRRNE